MTKNMLYSLPGVFASGFMFIMVVLLNPPYTAAIAALLALILQGFTVVYLGGEADYWEERYRTHRNCGDRSDR